MAIREKTISFAFDMTTVISTNAVVTNFNQITVFIPESSPTFTSVYVELGFQDAITATGGTITEHRCGLRLGAAAYTTINETDDISNTGENIGGVIGPFDYTTHFNTNWTGTSMTCDLQFYFNQSTGTTLGMHNVTGILYITYTYDDTVATQIKTVRIPLESLTGALPTSATNYGVDQIPQLTGVGGMLPEAGIVIRDYYFLLEGNEYNNGGVADFTISCNIDGGATTSFMLQNTALASDRFCRWIYRPAIPTTTTTHNFQLWASVAKAHNLTATLIVTYEFTLAGTTRVLNSIIMPFEIASPLGRNTSALSSRYERSFYVTDPGTITLQQSAVRIHWMLQTNVGTQNWKVGAQTYRAYTNTPNLVCGMFCLQQRIDAGAEQGAGIVLSRGSNNISIDGYATGTANEMTNINGVIILNYTSDISPDGVGAHPHTVSKVLSPWNAALSDYLQTSDFAFSIPESDYRIMSVGYCITLWVASSTMSIGMDFQCLPGEGKGGGYYDIYTDAYLSDSERSCSLIWMQGRSNFKRFPQDVGSDRVDVTTARKYRMYSSTTSGQGIVTHLTYHGMTWTVAGNITGNDALLSTTVELVDVDASEIVQRQVLAPGVTAFSFTVYDDTQNYFVNAFQDNAHLGRSQSGVGV